MWKTVVEYVTLCECYDKCDICRYYIRQHKARREDCTARRPWRDHPSDRRMCVRRVCIRCCPGRLVCVSTIIVRMLFVAGTARRTKRIGRSASRTTAEGPSSCGTSAAVLVLAEGLFRREGKIGRVPVSVVVVCCVGVQVVGVRVKI